MRVLHVHSGNLYGGVETILVTLARQRDLCPQMESHFALCFEGRLSKELVANGARVYRLGKTRLRHPASVVRARRSLRDLLNREKFDLAVIHSAWSQAIFGSVFRSARLPLVFWFHNAAAGRNWLDRLGEKTAPDLALCNSDFTATSLRKRHLNVRTEVVYCPVAKEGSHSDTDRRATRAELETPEDATVIIQVSRMEHWKGHALHLQALSLISDLPDWRCWQVGGTQRAQEVKYLEQLKRLADRLKIADRVRFLNERSDVPRLLRAADIFCQPNTSPEPFGIALIEALYAGLPVVSTDLGGAREIVDDSCGILVLPHATAVANALNLLIENRAVRRRLGEAGPVRAVALTDVSSQMRQLQNCFLKVINGNGKTLGKNLVPLEVSEGRVKTR